jgi:hypothetical protein
MPPEQFGGRAVPASDLYSLGATLIYLVTGLHPADLPQRDLRIQFEQVVNLSPALSSWLKRMIQPSLDRRLTSATEALQAIEQPQQRQQSSIYPTVVRKPVGSKILLNQGADSLEILLPPKGFKLSILGWTAFALFWNLICLGMTSIFDVASINPFSALLLLLCWSLGIRMTLVEILFSLFGRVRISLDQQKMTVAYELLRFKYRRRPAPRSHICKVVHTKRRPVQSIGYAPGQCHAVEEPRLIIWSGTTKYELCTGKLLTDPELDWLAKELSDYLKLPIARE